MNHKKVFINGKIYTVNSKKDWAEAVVVSNNKIIYVGSSKGAQVHIDDFAEVTDLKGKLMLPGFIDSHAHLVMGGQFLLNVDLTNVQSKSEFCNKLKEFATVNPNKWITGGNWNHQNWKKVELPHKSWIDPFTTDIPVFVSRMDYHIALANSYVLKLAGIDRDTKNPIGGEIEKDQFGEPTGILKDKAMDLVYDIIPKSSETELAEAVDAAMNEAKKLGVTSIHDISYDNHFPALQRAERSGKLNTRVYSSQLIKNYKDLISNGIQHNSGNDFLRTGTVKAFADGSLGSQTAYMFEPYSDNPDNVGLPMEEMSNGQLEEMILESDKNKLQCCIHA
ncbi:MAG: amidohydrolase family protein, partial [Bacteroidota bacterium]